MSTNGHAAERIIALDPSSTIVGYAAMNSRSGLIEAGLISPVNRSAGSYDRIVSLRSQLRKLLDAASPSAILIEWTKGKVGKRHHGHGAGLAVYGCGVGAIATECEHWCMLRRPHGSSDHIVIPVLENDWTGGVQKEVRQLAIASEYPAYHISDDPGGDAADAIGLARWWLKEKRLFGR